MLRRPAVEPHYLVTVRYVYMYTYIYMQFKTYGFEFVLRHAA